MKPMIHRRDKLIIVAIDIIHELGLQGFSTREIAKREGVSEATLFRHYKSKNELLLSVLKYYTRFDQDIYLSTRMMNLSSLEAIRYFIKSYMEYYENYPAITSIIFLTDELRRDPDMNELVLQIKNQRLNNLQFLIDKAQRNKDIDQEADSKLIAEIITGTVNEICLNWRVNGQEFSLKERTLAALDIILRSLNKKNGIYSLKSVNK